MGMEWLFFLLPLAALSGWWAARGRPGRRKAKDCPPVLNTRYYQGLNYLLDEQPDAALDVFIGLSELDSESVEIQFALAALFLRRGEVDRAVRIHQNLIARPTLSPQHKRQALFALGKDYMSAGLFDRAENLFRDLLHDDLHGDASRTLLLNIYQQEKEWQKAIDIAQQLRGTKAGHLAPVVAQYHCELAEQAMRKGDTAEFNRCLRRALDWDRQCVRASLLEAQQAQRQGQAQQVLRACKRVEEQDPELLPLILESVQQAYLQLERMDEYQGYLVQLVRRHPQQPLIDALVQVYLQRGERNQAELLINETLSKQPTLSNLGNLLDVLRERHADPVQWQRLRDATQSLLQSKPRFLCRQCGYQGRNMQWLCPSCKQWNSIKPL